MGLGGNDVRSSAGHQECRNRLKKGREVGYPQFKKKGIRDSFRADNGPATKGANAVPVDGKMIKLTIIGWVRIREAVRLSGTIQSTTFIRIADGWYISLIVEISDALQAKTNNGVVGIDLRLKRFATLAIGEFIVGPKPHRALEKRLRWLNQSLSRKTKGRANFRKEKAKVSRLHKRIADIRQDAVHKLSHRVATEFSVIGTKTLMSGEYTAMGLSETRLEMPVCECSGRKLNTKPR